MVNVAAIYSHAGDAAIHGSWVTEMTSAVNPPDDSAYVNFLGAEGSARVRDAYPAATWNRLRAVKRDYDPTNFFRLNQNIPLK